MTSNTTGMTADATTGMTGGCQCGRVRYRLKSAPTGASICHCRMCQKAFGNYFAPLTGVPLPDLVWTKEPPGIFKSSDVVERGFCPSCGTPLTYRYLKSDRIGVSIGSLDHPEQITLEIQYGIEKRLPAFATLHELPGEVTDPNFSARSNQHPDHD